MFTTNDFKPRFSPPNMKLVDVKDRMHKNLYSVLSKEFKEFRPSQEKAIESGLFDRKNLLVCSPTASGKTLVAEMAALQAILDKRGKAVYIVPLKSLASEKYHEFKNKYEKLGIKVAIAIGDLDSADPWLENYDFIIATAEKLDSLIRHQAKWVKQVSVVIVDEIHLLTDSHRGPVLEVLLTLLKQTLPWMQIIGLSATIGNPDELSEWLDAKLVSDDWRPVTLYQGIFKSNEVDYFGEKKLQPIPGNVSDPTLRICLDLIDNNKQALVFCPTKIVAESVATKLANILPEKSPELSKKALKALTRPTRQCKKLSDCISHNVAFHHAGLVRKQKQLIEDNFRQGKIKVISCTPTLAMGLNLPADVAIMKSLKRFSGRWGSVWIPVLEYHQMTGRAGRPGKSEEGLAISLATTESEKELLYRKFICGDPEEITSKLASEPVLRISTLALIASNFVNDKESLLEFFKSSFYGFQYGDDWSFESKIWDIAELLHKYEFIKIDGDQITATKIGKRISELYIDPDTAHMILQALDQDRTIVEFGLIHLVCNAMEMLPVLRAGAKDAEYIEDGLIQFEKYILTYLPKEWDPEYDHFIGTIKTALMFTDWIDEKSEDYVLEKYKIRPGELHVKRSNAEWLLYAASELARLRSMKSELSYINKTRVRMKHGIKEELISLVKLRNIGRFRARLLFRAGIKSAADVKKTSTISLAKILKSVKIAESIKTQTS